MLSHCGLVTLYGDVDLDQRWLWWWLGAVGWRYHQFHDIHLREISLEIPQPSATKINFNITYYVKFHSDFWRANELM